MNQLEMLFVTSCIAFVGAAFIAFYYGLKAVAEIMNDAGLLDQVR